MTKPALLATFVIQLSIIIFSIYLLICGVSWLMSGEAGTDIGEFIGDIQRGMND